MIMAVTGLPLIRQVLADPSSDPAVALVLLSVVVVAVLLVAVLLLLALVRSPEDDYEDATGESGERTGAAGEPEPGERQDDEPHEKDDAGGRGRTVAMPSAEEYEYPEMVPEEFLIKKEPETAEELEAARLRRPRRLSRRAVGRLMLASVLVLLLLATFAATSTDWYCTGLCHAHASAVSLRAKDAHAKVACVSCHEDATIAGTIGAPAIRTGHLLRLVSASWGSPMGPVSSGSCLTCHGDIRGRTLTVAARDVRMSHDAPLSRGMSCDDCHVGTGHSGGAPALVPMSRCTGCHDGRTAPSACATCHPVDPSAKPRPSDQARTYAKVPLGRIGDCGDCHDQSSCDACHDLRLPHTGQFIAWSHARDAAFGGRAVCLRCHTLAECIKCHPGFAPGSAAAATHPADWRTSHAKLKRGTACDCHWSRLPAEGQAGGDYCAVCH
jgi:nitrate/TMAO reductase-like tetraheme cytochrome c subunit